ncbi:nucleophile aminohydrolase [Thelonectria olida]|uniref:Nucleophile aminohydrolase n=1 Tax=Thelonectria olida TaxID=1576542 RepID=A0A9P9AP25_9HYPO|nr:nucleophile aminohydrolase [Thelonectria olida]
MHTSYFTILASLLTPVLACSRVTYNSTTSRHHTHFVVGRSLDSLSPTNTTIWAFPPGARRFGGVQDNPFVWTSKHGTVSAVVNSTLYTEGVNTRGLAGSALLAQQSVFQERKESRPSIFSGVWMQYFLDMHASVHDVAEAYCPDEGGEEPFQVVPELILDEIEAKLRVVLSDAAGDNLIIEFVDGRLRCHHSEDFTVSTDGPSYEEQTAVNKFWQPIGQESLPGTSRASDRFVRLSHYNALVPHALNPEAALSYTAGMVRAVSTPMLPSHKNKKHDTDAGTWPTQWRVYTDLDTQKVYYESATSPLSFWYDVNELNMTEGAEPMVLTVDHVPPSKRMRDVTDKFETVTENSCIWTDCER